MVNVSQQPQFLRRLHNRPALRRRSGLVVFLQLALVASGVGVGGGLAYLFHEITAGDRTFLMRELELSGVPVALRPDVARRLEWARGRNLLTADLDRARRSVESVPEVAAARVRRLLPATLEVAIDVREPAARLVAPDGSWAVSADGVILGARTDLSLPEIRVADELGSRLDDSKRVPAVIDRDAFARAVAVHETLRTAEPAVIVEAVRLDPRGTIVTLSDPALEILVRDGDGLLARIELVTRLQAGRPLATGTLVDLRYPDMMIVNEMPVIPASDGD